MYLAERLQIIDSMSLSFEHEKLLREQLIPAHYLMISSKKAKTAEHRHRIAQRAEQLFSWLKSNDIWTNTEQSEQSHLMKAAKECAQLFQRSSSGRGRFYSG